MASHVWASERQRDDRAERHHDGQVSRTIGADEKRNGDAANELVAAQQESRGSRNSCCGGKSVGSNAEKGAAAGH
jgi:hypothetical protein